LLVLYNDLFVADHFRICAIHGKWSVSQLGPYAAVDRMLDLVTSDHISKYILIP